MSVFDYIAHQINENTIRIRFDEEILNNSNPGNILNYTLSSLEIPGTFVIPTIEEAQFEDESNRVILLKCNKSFTYGKNYQLQISNLTSIDGDTVNTTAHSFFIGVHDFSKALYSILSDRGSIDVIFDKPVGPTTLAPVVIIISDLVPSLPLAFVPWTPALPPTTLRFDLPLGLNGNFFQITGINYFDESKNVGTFNLLPLNLLLRSPAPYSYVDVTQIQIISAYANTVCNDWISNPFSLIKIQFNGPIDSVSVNNTANWSVFEHAPHLNADPFDTVVSIPIVNLVIFANEFKSKFNNHLIELDIHRVNDNLNTITSPNAILIQEAIDIINEAQIKYVNHLNNNISHDYRDTINTIQIVTIPPGNLPVAVAISNTLKAAFNNHQLAEYPVNVLSSRALNFDPILSTYSFVAELKVNQTDVAASYRVTCVINSFDLASTTNPLNYTGSSEVRSAIAEPVVAQSHPEIGSAIVQFNKQISINQTDDISINPEVPVGFIEDIASLSSTMFCLDNMIVAYSDYHLGFAPHQIFDITNIILPGERPGQDLLSIIASVNIVKTKFNLHVSSEVYHNFVENSEIVVSPDAFDLRSLFDLVRELRDKYLAHYQNLTAHLGPSSRVFSAGLEDILKINLKNIKFEQIYDVSSPVISSTRNNFINSDYVTNSFFSTQFYGISSLPFLASAIPRIALIPANDPFNLDQSFQLSTDLVEAWMSKEMSQDSIISMIYSLPSIIVKDILWKDDRTLLFNIASMDATGYILTITDLQDQSGNVVS